MNISDIFLKNVFPSHRKESITTKEKATRDIFRVAVEFSPDKDITHTLFGDVDKAFEETGEEREILLGRAYIVFEENLFKYFDGKKIKFDKEQFRQNIRKVVSIDVIDPILKVIFLPKKESLIVLYEMLISYLSSYVTVNAGSYRIIKAINSQKIWSVITEIKVDGKNIDFRQFNAKISQGTKYGIKEIIAIFSFLSRMLISEITLIFSDTSAENLVNKFFQKIKLAYDYDIIASFLDIIPEGMLEKERVAFLSREELESKVRQRTDDLKKQNAIIEEKVKERTNELNEEKLKLSVVTENMLEGAILLNDKRNIIYINETASKMLNIELAKSEDFSTLLEQFSKKFFKINLEETLNRITNGEKYEISEIDSGSGIYRIIFMPVVDREMKRTLIWIEDITQSKILERRKSEFLSVVAHQMRTPLSAIKWALELSLKENLNACGVDIKDLLEKAYESNDRMIKLIGDMLEANKITSGKIEYYFVTVSFNDLLQSVIYDVMPEAKKKGVIINYNPSSVDGPGVDVDPEKMRAVVQNLLDNAVKYTPSGGKIDVQVKNIDDRIRLEISDSGIGISDEEKVNIFSRFFRGSNAIKTHADGSGLGLFIAKNVIEAHKGSIKFESELNKGTKFIVEIPRRQNIKNNNK